MLFEGRYKTQDYFQHFLHLLSIPSFIFSRTRRMLILGYPQRIVSVIHYLYSKAGFTYANSIQYKMLLVHLHVYIGLLILKGGHLDFSQPAEFKNLYITEIYMKKQYKSSIIKNFKITEKRFFDGVPLKGYVGSLVIFRYCTKNQNKHCVNIR